MERPSKLVPVELNDGTVVIIEATLIGEQKVAFQKIPFGDAMAQGKAIIREIAENLQEFKQEFNPEKISVKIGLEIAVESGQLTTMLVKGSGKANLELTLEWGDKS